MGANILILRGERPPQKRDFSVKHFPFSKKCLESLFDLFFFFKKFPAAPKIWYGVFIVIWESPQIQLVDLKKGRQNLKLFFLKIRPFRENPKSAPVHTFKKIQRNPLVIIVIWMSLSFLYKLTYFLPLEEECLNEKNLKNIFDVSVVRRRSLIGT